MAAQTPSWPVTVTGIALSEGTLLPNAGRFGLSRKLAAANRGRPPRQATSIVFAATGGFLGGMIATALLMVAFRGLPAPAPLSSSTISSPVTPVESAAPVNDATEPAEATGLVRQAEEELRTRRLEVPIPGVRRRALPNTFDEQRDGPGPHAALDLPAPRNTPVVAVEDGTIARLYEGTEGGLAVYQFDPSGAYAYYYAHLDRYADGLKKGTPVKRGQVLGYVGTTGNAPAGTPQLHFAILALDEAKRWWNGTPVDPLAVLP
jgi:peptidoglycan LD-endopeptidase LytH